MKSCQSATGRTRLRELGEDLLLEKLLSPPAVNKRVIAGTGDDAAIVAGSKPNELVVLKTDCVVERIHFDGKTKPEEIGWKAMMRPLSDFAAVSGLPEFALVTLIVGKEKKVEWVTRLYRGLRQAGLRFNVSIVGGETSATPGPAAISVSVVGHVEKDRWVSRSGGKPGDHLFVTGRLGGSIRGRHLRFVPRIAESRWLTATFRVRAMMDLSDGLGADLPRLARASRVGFEIERKAIPLNRKVSVENAISDGEDYELLFAVSARDSSQLRQAWAKKFPRVPLSRIGCLTPRSAIPNRQLKGGYVHFK
jgi:thiamine-monophosphate kinase